MTVHGIEHINLSALAKSLAALREFYCDVLGLQPGVRPPLRSAGLWLYAGGAPIVHLVERAAPAPPDAQAVARSALDHVALRCSGLEQAIQRLRQLGVAHVVNAAG